jgi:hypothetical protein
MRGAWPGWTKPVVVGGSTPKLGRSDHGGGQLDDVLLVVQCSMSFGLHGDDRGRPGYLELEVGVAGYGHELDITWLPQDDVCHCCLHQKESSGQDHAL